MAGIAGLRLGSFPDARASDRHAPRRSGEAAGSSPDCRPRRDVIVRTAALADELGYELFAVPEGWGLDSAPVLAEIAMHTTRIQLASGVLSVWGRTPATLAITAATLDQISGGRYVLGLGVSTRALAEGFHDTPFEHPARKLRDVVILLPPGLPWHNIEATLLAAAPSARPARRVCARG